MIFLILASMFAGIALVSMFIPRVPACVAGYVAVWMLRLSPYGCFDDSTMIFWGLATAIVVGIGLMLPSAVARAMQGVPYISGGAIVGGALGMVMNSMAAVIVAAAVAALFGAIAYTRTPGGRQILDFPTSRFFNYFAAKALPAIVTVAMVSLVFLCLISLP